MFHPPTPCLVVNAEIVRRNISSMQAYVNQHGLELRPHTKTHKSIHVGTLQREAGAYGLTVAKAGEAAVMAQVTNNVMMAYPPVDLPRCERLAKLACDASLVVGLDSELAVERLAKATQSAESNVDVLVDVDIGYQRTGVQSDEDAVRLAQCVERSKSLQLKGLMLYAGKITGSAAEQTLQMQQLNSRLKALLPKWDAAGLCREVISSGSTPSAKYSHLVPAVTEIRPGTYVYNDMNIVRGGYCEMEDCAARIHATVVSANVKGQVVIDAGSKTLTSDKCGPDPSSGFGHVTEYPAAKIFSLTEEHGQVDISKCDRVPELGERVTIIPNHICVCVNMQDSFWWCDAEAEPRQLPVDARGLLI
ncbi:MAG: D-TA family PLP-dependent enzyme [Planctomycetaceae bacterium]|nr:D-TA family PLP-dependent enzyme [Planctomycetaceae bacterium]